MAAFQSPALEENCIFKQIVNFTYLNAPFLPLYESFRAEMRALELVSMSARHGESLCWAVIQLVKIKGSVGVIIWCLLGGQRVDRNSLCQNVIQTNLRGKLPCNNQLNLIKLQV